MEARFIVTILLGLVLTAYSGPAAEIHDAARDGNLEKLKQILSTNAAALNQKDYDGNTPLHEAARAGEVAAISFLLAQKADPNQVNKNGMSALRLARGFGREEAAKLLATVAVEVVPAASATSTNSGSQSARAKILGGMRKIGFKDQPVANTDRSILKCDGTMTAAVYGTDDALAMDMVIILNSEAFRADQEDALERWMKSVGLAEEVITLFCSNGNAVDTYKQFQADAFQPTQKLPFVKHLECCGRSFDYSFSTQSGVIVSVRALKPVKPTEQANRADDLISLIHSNALREAKRLLMEKPALAAGVDEFGGTPLHAAAFVGDVDLADVLFAKGADLNASIKVEKPSRAFRSERPASLRYELKATDGSTPLHYASANGHLDVVTFLISNGAKVNSRDKIGGWTPLHLAASSGHREVVRLLLKSGADLNARDIDGYTASELAKQAKYDSIVALLTTSP